MAYEVVATAEFDALLDEAVAFRVDNYGRRSARRLLDSIDKLGNHLASKPFMGRLVDDDADGAESLRWVRADSYIAIYRVHEEHGEIALIKLLSATSNWRRRVLL